MKKGIRPPQRPPLRRVFFLTRAHSMPIDPQSNLGGLALELAAAELAHFAAAEANRRRAATEPRPQLQQRIRAANNARAAALADLRRAAAAQAAGEAEQPLLPAADPAARRLTLTDARHPVR